MSNTTRRRRPTLRFSGYDYTTAGAYFVTICTYQRRCSLEDSAWQAVVRTAWRRAVCGGAEPQPHDFVIMPNHVHGIVWLPAKQTGVGAQRPGSDVLVVNGAVLVGKRRSDIPGAAPLSASVKVGSLGAVIRGFKSASTVRINRMRGTPGGDLWQRGYYDRVIRGDAELARIRCYIRDNPAKWEQDRNHPSNLAKLDSVETFPA